MSTVMSQANDPAEKSRDGVRLLTAFTIAHGIFHFMQQSFAVMLPAIKETFGISAIQIGALMTAKEIAMGVSSLPGGVLSDRLRRHRSIIMAACMALFGLSWLLIGIASVYPLLIFGMCFTIYVTFLPLYMEEGPGLSSQSTGFHFGLLWAVGIVASPLMGHLSDRFGRKPVLVPALLCSGTLTIILALFGQGIMFTVIIGVLGVFLRSDYALLTAAILDIVGQKVATTVLGVLSFLRFVMAAIATLVAGYLYQNFGMKAVLFFVAALFGISAALFAGADLTTRRINSAHIAD